MCKIRINPDYKPQPIDTRLRELYYNKVIPIKVYLRLRDMRFEDAVEVIKNDFNIDLGGC